MAEQSPVWGPPVHGGYYTGNNFMNLAEIQQTLYAGGFIDGLLASSSFCKWANYDAFVEKVTGTTAKQAAAIIRKFLEERPERWHYHLNILALEAMGRAFNMKLIRPDSGK